jgi:hypothetical protein
MDADEREAMPESDAIRPAPDAFARLQRAMRRAMSDRKTLTGIEFKITGFLEFHTDDLFTENGKDPKKAKTEIEELLTKHGFVGVKVKTEHRNRKTIDDELAD